jgi:ribosomal protein S12 methylthiotransferase
MGEADVVIVNTCAFIQEAVDESLSAIFKVAEKGKRIVVCGCLPGRYPGMLAEKMPEVDAFFQPYDLEGILAFLTGTKRPIDHHRLRSTPRSYAYLKIADGCDRHCSYCVIPGIKGAQRSESPEQLVRQTKDLVQDGVREFVLVSQDLTAYGKDLGTDLVSLLKKLVKVHPDARFRLLYLFPNALSGRVLDYLCQEPSVFPYFDIPVQHSSPSILRKMRRPSDRRFLLGLMEEIRRRRPDAVLRTTLIAGFPGETKRDFQDLCSFVKEVRFNHLGVFPYSREEGSEAAKFGSRIQKRVVQQRVAELMGLQKMISASHLESFQGKRLECVVDAEDGPGRFVARNYYFAPEIDGVILVRSKRKIAAAEKVRVKIVRTGDYDLYAEEDEG